MGEFCHYPDQSKLWATSEMASGALRALSCWIIKMVCAWSVWCIDLLMGNPAQVLVEVDTSIDKNHEDGMQLQENQETWGQGGSRSGLGDTIRLPNGSMREGSPLDNP